MNTQNRERRVRRLWIGLLLALLLAGLGVAAWAQAPSGAVGVYYVGPEDAIAVALSRAAPYLARVDRPELARVFVINNIQPDYEDLRVWGRQVQRETVGLVIFCGPNFPTSAGEDLQPLLGVSTFVVNRRDDLQALTAGSARDPLSSAVNWSSAPPLAARTTISNPNLLQSIALTTVGDPVAQRLRGRERFQVMIVDAWLEHPSNAAWQQWPYYNYIIYRLIAEAGGATRALSFAQYPLSPVPHDATRLLFTIAGAALLFLTLSIFFLARRTLFLRPQLLDGPYRAARPPAGDWERVGFHRPLAGFLYAMAAGAFLFIPLALYQVYLLPEVLLPWPQTLEFWELSAQWLAGAWLLFDLGAGVAMVRRFAELRIYTPREGFRYVQAYFWWQLLSGAARLVIVGLLAVTVFPQTTLAHLAFYFLVHACTQFPGFLRIFGLFFRAVQRLDHEQRIHFTLWLTGPLFSGATILWLRQWGAAQPAVGEALGGMIGLGVGLYLAEVVAFGVGLILYRQLGYRLRPVLAPSFDWRILGSLFAFGAKLAFGDIATAAGYLAQGALIAVLVDVAIWRQSWLLISSVAALYTLLGSGLYDGLMPALVETYTQGYISLSRYYISQAFRYGLWFSILTLALLAAIGDRFLLGILGASAAPAVIWVIPALFVGLFEWPVWLANRTLEAANRPGVRSWVMVGAQGVRLVLVFLFTRAWGIPGLLWALLLSAMLHGLVAWLWVGRLVLRPRVYLWQTLIAPVGAGVLVYNILRLAGDLWWQPEPAASLWLTLGAFVVTLPCYALLTGLLGGWDDNGLEELRRATRLSGLGQPIGWLVLRCVTLGARVSPLHNAFVMPLSGMAEEEAHALTLRRKPLE